VSSKRFAAYGKDAAALEQMIEADSQLGQALHPGLSLCPAQIIWAARHEMARTIDDVLSRRIRALQLDAHAAIEAAPLVADLLGRELGRDRAWVTTQVEEFRQLASGYLTENRVKMNSSL
jgi:glycerol-3-phosphate dehydrogenase